MWLARLLLLTVLQQVDFLAARFKVLLGQWEKAQTKILTKTRKSSPGQAKYESCLTKGQAGIQVFQVIFKQALSIVSEYI